MGIPKPRESLIKNLRFLMRREGLSEERLATRAGVAQKTINKILNNQSAPTLDTVDKIAEAFGINLWHLVMPALPEELISSPSIEALYNAFKSASPRGREHISLVAEREAHYSKIGGVE